MQTECLRDGGQDQIGILKRGQRDEADPIGVGPLDLARNGQRQARLAHTAGAGQGEQTNLRAREQGTGGGDLPLAPKERGEWHREW